MMTQGILVCMSCAPEVGAACEIPADLAKIIAER
jgi:hypothetical protein